MARQYTKELIKREFLKMLEEKSLKSITIARLAERCEINRNTFYYHYDDIYMLVKEILQDELEKVDKEFNETYSWEEGLLHAVSFFLEHKKAAQNIFRSIDKKDTDAYLYKACKVVMSKYVENQCRANHIEAKAEDKNLIIDFYVFALIGLLDKWIQDGMNGSPKALIYRLGKLFQGSIERSLRTSQQLDEDLEHRDKMEDRAEG